MSVLCAEKPVNKPTKKAFSVSKAKGRYRALSAVLFVLIKERIRPTRLNGKKTF